MNDVAKVGVHLQGHGVACQGGFKVNVESSGLRGLRFCRNAWKIGI